MYRSNSYRTRNPYARKRKYPYTSTRRGTAKRTYNSYAPKSLTAVSAKQYNVFESKHHYHANHIGSAHCTHGTIVTPNGNGESYGIKSLCRISQGTGFTQRIGAKISIVQVNLNFQPLWHGCRAGAIAAHLILDTQANGSGPAYGDIFTNAITAVDPQKVSGTFRNAVNKDRFKFIKSWYFGTPSGMIASVMDNAQGPGVGGDKIPYVGPSPKVVSVKGRWDIYYADESADLASVKSNDLLLVVQTDNQHTYEQSFSCGVDIVFLDA